MTEVLVWSGIGLKTNLDTHYCQHAVSPEWHTL